MLRLVSCERCGLPTGSPKLCEGCDPLLRETTPPYARFLFDPEARREHGLMPMSARRYRPLEPR